MFVNIDVRLGIGKVGIGLFINKSVVFIEDSFIVDENRICWNFIIFI